MKALLSPISGKRLWSDTPHSLFDGECRWPVIDGIPYLRTGRTVLVRDALAYLDRGDITEALILLLIDQDDWWDGGLPDRDAVLQLIRQRDSLCLREAMELLGYGRVGDYFAHRWSDPTFLAGLALIDAHWTAPQTAFELACGIGHYLRELTRLGVFVTGADVVFSKLWLARHWVVGAGTGLVCFDAAWLWPLQSERFDLALCHDAFYFLEPKVHILAALRTVVEEDGCLLISHIHNSARDNASAGRGISVAALDTMFPDGIFYDDAELTRALADDRMPTSVSSTDLENADAFAVAATSGLAQPAQGKITVPSANRTLRRNPLYGDVEGTSPIRWPSERYAREYGALATYPPSSTAPLFAVAGRADDTAVRCREYVDLPERW